VNTFIVYVIRLTTKKDGKLIIIIVNYAKSATGKNK